jgi:general secretion pathway protein G
LPGQNEPLLTSSKVVDPWGHAYVYTIPGQHGKFDIVCLGADGVEGGEGENADIYSWDDTTAAGTSSLK